MEFFQYAITVGEGVSSNYADCVDSCNKQQSFSQKCCAELTMDMGSQQDLAYVCMNQSVAAADMNMSIAGANVKVTCVGSGAKRLVTGALAAVLAFVAI
jgi:hypothetical protein